MGGDANPTKASQHKRSVSGTFNEALDSRSAPTYPYQRRIRDHYNVVGFISSGTYGRVYKAVAKADQKVHAIKKFKPDKEGQIQYTGISQSAIREMALCTELSHQNVIALTEIILESKCIFMIFEYAEHDLLQIIHWHTQHPRTPIPATMLRSVIYQLLDGLAYLHANWVMHRDLKPANIMVSTSGQIKIGDLGLARLFQKPLQSLFAGDKVVVTIWYRAPELVLGARHYTPAIDLWAVGCIFAELISLRPIFKGEEAKPDATNKPNNKKPSAANTSPFQTVQMAKIGEILGLPRQADWPLLSSMPEFAQLAAVAARFPSVTRPRGLDKWWDAVVKSNNYSSVSPTTDATGDPPDKTGLALLQSLLEFDPLKRLDAKAALGHAYFEQGAAAAETTGLLLGNCFKGVGLEYPSRKVSSDDNDISVNSLPGTKRAGEPDDRPAKRVKEA